MNKISQCTITLTRNCNLRCSFCYAKETKYVIDDSIDFDQLLKVIDFCDEAEVKYLVFTGGEPLLYYKIIDALKYIKTKRNKMSPSLATNGIMLQNIDFCKDLVYNGIEYIDVSLKGKDDEECINQVGKSCHISQMAAINNLSKCSVEFTCSMVITMNNVFSLCETVEKALNHGAKQFSFTFVIDNEQSVVKGFKYLERNNYFQLIEAFTNQIDNLNKLTQNWWVEFSYPMCAYTEKQRLLLRGKLSSPCQIRHSNGITFDPNLNLIPCNMYFDNIMGQLGKDFSNYDEYLKYAESEKCKNIINKINILPSEKCITCEYIGSCLGGCPVTWKNCSFTVFEEFKNHYLSISN